MDIPMWCMGPFAMEQPLSCLKALQPSLIQVKNTITILHTNGRSGREGQNSPVSLVGLLCGFEGKASQYTIPHCQQINRHDQLHACLA